MQVHEQWEAAQEGEGSYGSCTVTLAAAPNIESLSLSLSQLTPFLKEGGGPIDYGKVGDWVVPGLGPP